MERVALIGAAAVPALHAALADGSENLRAGAAAALGQIADPAAAPALLQVLESDPDGDVRAAAAEALGKIGDRNSLDGLRRALDDQSERVRKQAVAALGRLKDAKTCGALLQLLHSGTREVREACALALGEIGDRSAVSGLVQALQDGDERYDVRRAAARSLGLLGDAAAIEPLRAALSDDDTEVRYAAAEALIGIKDTASIPLIVDMVKRFEGGSFPYDVIGALGTLGGSAVPALLTLLYRDKRWGNSFADSAAKALQAIGTGEAVAAARKWARENE